MNVLITGGAGFIGSHLIRYLNKQGNSITIFDNFSNSSNAIISGYDIKLIEGDILDYSLLSKSLKNIDIVIHLAAQISVIDSIKNPQHTMKINVIGTQNVLDACLENNVKNFIAISSAAIFGNQDTLLTENSNPEPISPYGQSKLLMEKRIIDFSKKHLLNSIILRFFNLYGSGQSSQYAGVITKFLENIRENKPLEIYGTGNQTRDFIHIDDAIECIHLAIKHINKNTAKIYNVGSGKSTSILDLANLLSKLSGRNLPINFKPDTKGTILYSKTSIALAKKELGFEPKISLQAGLSKFFQSYS
ncbi:MAG: NAD-dependent epimerase/dehydratase family protein [Nitrosarchaeum sp.]|nr:NAD-dependent epimerase/dehydratase family protein [Nitrosarchaeum sp.]